MAVERFPRAQSKQIGNDTIFTQDDDDYTARLWELMKKKEKLQQQIETISMKIDCWYQVLQCSTREELNDLLDSFSAEPTLLPPSISIHHPSSTTDCLQKYHKTVTRLNIHQLLDCAQACSTKEGNLFVKFPCRTANRPRPEYVLLLKPGPDHTYSVVTHNVPPSVPIDDLEKKYLQKPQGPEGLRRFVAVVGQYTRPLYTRLQQIMSAENLRIVDGSVRHNDGLTTLSFIVDPRLKEHPLLLCEFVLRYHPMDIFPHTITAAPICLSGQVQVPPGLQEALDEAAEKMKTNQFPQVLLETARATRSSLSASQGDEDSQESAQSLGSMEDLAGPLFDIGE